MQTWKPVVGWEGIYEVSDRGNLRSLDRVTVAKDGRVRKWPGVSMRTTPDSYGYMVVSLARDGVTKVKKVHQLVLLAFRGPPPSPKHMGRHKDGNPANNRMSNVFWGTNTDNMRDRERHGRGISRGRNPKAKLSEKQVKEIKQLRQAGWTLVGLAERFGVHVTTISRIIHNLTWK